MKRRVPSEDRRREPRQLERGAEARREDGLGAAASSLRAGMEGEAPPVAPVIAPE